MRTPIFIRPLTEDEQRQIQAGLRSSDAFVMRRCQILLSIGARGTSPGDCPPAGLRRPDGAQCDPRVQCHVDWRCCKKAPRAPIGCIPASRRRAGRLKDLLHRSPRDFGKERGSVDPGVGSPGQPRARASSPPPSPTKACAVRSNA